MRRMDVLRADMKQSGIDLFLCVSTDPHMSEYLCDHFKVTEYFSGCTSDNVVLAVDAESAALWTDGRYFISAERELFGTGITLMKSGDPGVPEVKDYLSGKLSEGMTLGFDGRTLSAADGARYREAAKKSGAKTDSTYDPADRLWAGRPALPKHPVWLMSPDFSGETTEEKLGRVREETRKAGAVHHILTKLDDIMWVLNIRGADVACNPVAFSYLLIGPETADLFLQKEEVTEELSAYLKEQKIKLHEYGDAYTYIRDYHFTGPVLMSGQEASYTAWSLVSAAAEIVDRLSPAALLKAKKNPVEIAHIKKTYELDSAAVCRFIFYIKRAAGKEEITEITAAQKIDALRAGIPDYLELSFPTISAYGANAAMAHYAPSPENCSKVETKGFLLVDSGGQYKGGTTDVTRTIAVGPLTDEMKRDFTLVAAANLRLLFTRFPDGTCGAHLDMVAREVLYRYGLDYNHGTGHGIGFCLGVHEGPQRISRAVTGGGAVKIEPGMIISDEPGVYKEGRYGIRTESIMLCEADEKTEFGQFYRFVPLTYAPIDLAAIDTRYMEDGDIERLNSYHRSVYEKISPYLGGEDLEDLKEATRAITR